MHKVTVIDTLQLLEFGHIHVRRVHYLVEDDGTRTKLEYHRVAYEPGANLDAEESIVQNVARVAWTPEVVAAHQARLAANRARRQETRGSA